MRNRGIAAVLLVALMLVCVVPSGFAERETGALMVSKLFRGIANAATGWMEIFKQISITWDQSGPGTGLSWGLVKGVGYAVARSMAGAYEIVTFPLPVPEDYKPIIQPEYVLSDINESLPGHRTRK